mmetsp:Transcript_25203/g.48287  ORF Transcript_25203/g.48287 Transcript_25203/m.48287 type:complete len:501 (-) Transcript_25203:206-1708(-)
MKKVADSDLTTPLLGTDAEHKGPSLAPLFCVAFLNTVSRIAAQTPAYSLLFHEVASAGGMQRHHISMTTGWLMAMRSLVELACPPLLARWSDRVGRRRSLGLCCLAYCVEYGLLSVLQSTLGFSLVFIAGGMLASHNVIEGSCIVDATSCPRSRSKAFGQLFAALGFGFILGPIIGGELSAIHSGAPFVAAMMLSICNLMCVLVVMPEYLPEKRRCSHQSGGSVLSTLHAFKHLVGQNHQLQWYTYASALSSMGISAFITVRTIWAHDTFGWHGSQIGRVVATYGVTVVFAHFVLLPVLLGIMRGREGLLAQLCLLVHTARFTAYALAPHGGAVYTAVILSSAGSCSVPILQALSSQCVPEADQSLLSGGASALNTATQVIGALIGSHAFAHSLAGRSSASAHLLLCAMFCGLAAVCVGIAGIHASKNSDKPLKVKKRSARPWIAQAEGMHGMDASLPSPTMRGSMLLRGRWAKCGDSSPRHLAACSRLSKSDDGICALA